METHLSPEFASTPEGQQAEAILRNCVHCGFCTATCPTYQLLGDELDGPRGRIYQIKQVLEGEAPTRTTQLHLDRCLTCRNCETTCPSGVEYGRLVDIGRAVVDAKVERPAGEKFARWALREGMTSSLFAPAIKLGQALRPLVPAALRDKVPPRQRAGKRPQRDHARKVLMLGGCVQPTLMPNIGAATARVLDAVGVQPLLADGAGCCGAIRQHLSDHDGALADMKRNVDAWWPLVESGTVEAIVMDASGCGAMVKEYGHHLLHDPAYAERAQRISALCQDISEYLPQFAASLKTLLKNKPVDHLAYHPPCTLQHAQQVRGGAEALLRELGFEVKLPLESHL
ncbi:MAG: glycolate oxidase subunit GlcF, partial [Betaproteobacteria bacterium]|nr:glycolate oxidase subunit GlcF [Betaproteobacteria bacterium]